MSFPMQAPYPQQHIPFTNVAGQPSAIPQSVNGYARVQPTVQRPIETPQIYTAVYSGVAVYELLVNDVAIMKRRSDSWLNATQILKVAGVDKGKRTKILEKEILTGHHEKVQGGYGRYQGTWISYERGREFCRRFGVEELLQPLLDYDPGEGAQGDTPTKEQAMAANRKRFYNSSIDGRNNGQLSGNTFFQNISPTASNALAAMNMAARFDSPLPQKRPQTLARQSSHQQMLSQEAAFPGGSQQSVQSFTSDQMMDMNGQATPQYGPIGGQVYGKVNGAAEDAQEPPRKRLKPSMSQEDYQQVGPVLNSNAQVQVPSSFSQPQYTYDAEAGSSSLPPLYPPSDKVGEERRLALMDLFADPARTDWSNHTAILHLSGEDLDIPLDTSANTALHWAATLSKIPLLRLLIARGANMFRGNAAGQTSLMAAVSVNNSFDNSSFPEILDMLGPLIPFRDATGRTVLHHIAISSGIQGRSVSSRYYLESLLEFIVRQGAGGVAGNQQNSFDGSQKSKAIGLVHFMANVVNVQDKSGNTALNLVARIGVRPIINQLDELGADFNIPNVAGFRPTDFGVFSRGPQGSVEQQQQHHQQQHHQSSSSQTHATPVQSQPPSQIEQIREEIFATTNSILAQTQSQYANELSKSQALIDQQNASLRSVSKAHRAELDRLERLQRRQKERSDRGRKIANLRQCILEQRDNVQRQQQQRGINDSPHPASAETHKIDPTSLPSSPSPSASSEQQLAYLNSLPASSILRARLSAYTSNNVTLEAKLANLKSRSSDLEAMYRRVIALCTSTEEDKIDGLLESLVQAVESEGGGAVADVTRAGAEQSRDDVGRVREFLRKVEGVEG